MVGKYAYSANGVNYRGNFDTRNEAAEAGFEHARKLPSPPETIYVGRHVGGNPRANFHAKNVIAEMRQRIGQEEGESGSDFLRFVNDRQVKDLDAMLEQTILAWLAKHELMPTFSHIEAISEQPVPAKPRALVSR